MQTLLNEKFHAATFFKGPQVMAVENSAGWQLKSTTPVVGLAICLSVCKGFPPFRP
jgi:hypothetical protein